MAKKTKSYECLVTENVGCNSDGNPKFVFVKGNSIEGLSTKQVKYYKQIKYIK